MRIAIKSCILAAAFATITSFAGIETADAGNGWGWAKPLNKKVGSAFYTSNRNINNSYGWRSRAWRRANSPAKHLHRAPAHAHPIYPVPVYRAPVTFGPRRSAVPFIYRHPSFNRR